MQGCINCNYFVYRLYGNEQAFYITFRKNEFEPLQSIKRRNRDYWWMSKILKETIFVYGTDYGYDEDWDDMPRLLGPFYCGMSMVMNMPQFYIELLSPTSTSKHIEVAMKFSGKKGIIIEFNNNKGDAQFVNGLDVSWLSRFKEEEERYIYYLFMIYFMIYKLLNAFSECF